MLLKEIYRPIKKELISVEQRLRDSIQSTQDKSILEIGNYLLDRKGKRLRPALVLLSAKASDRSAPSGSKLINIATALELIHMASLIHDDVIDHSSLRHNKPTVNFKWGQDVSIALGDYLYSVAFELISDCGNSDIVRCVSSATKIMCEGEFSQVCERWNFDLMKEHYIVFVQKKTASLFVASCHSGALISGCRKPLQDAFKQYGLNFGTAFQIADDYLDLMGDERKLGKAPGQDVSVGEATLPILNLLQTTSGGAREELKVLLGSERNKMRLEKIRSRVLNSDAAFQTKETALSFATLAKKNLDTLKNSSYKNSLISLADFVTDRSFNRLRR